MRAAPLLGRLLGLALLALPGAALADLDDVLGPLAGKVLIGRQGDWEGSEDTEPDAYRLDYLGTRTNAVRYFMLDDAGVPEGRLAAGVQVALPQEKSAFAGLLWGYQDDPRRYLIFAVTGDGRAVIWRRDAAGLTQLAEHPDAVHEGGSAVLAAFERDGVVLMLAGETLVAALDGDDAAGGATGIVAGGRGSFRFTDFGVMDAADIPMPEEEGSGDPPAEAPEPPPPDELTPPPLPQPEPVPPPQAEPPAEPVPPPLPEPEPTPPPLPEPEPTAPPLPQAEPALTPPPLPTQPKPPVAATPAESVDGALLGVFGPPATVREAPLGAFATPAVPSEPLVPPPLPTAN